MRTAIERQQQGIQNLRSAPVNDFEIASLEPQMQQMVSKLARVVNTPSLLDLDSAKAANLMNGLASLRSVLPPSRADFNARFRSGGAASMISQALSQ
ncbi:unnamed protein product, partial [Strongylus vulgaris]